MARPRMRPSFRVQVACSGEEVRDAFERRLGADADGVEGDFSTRHGVLRVPESRRRFWTPCLDLTIDDDDSSDAVASGPRARLWGTFSPRAEVWTAFVFTIGTLVIVSVFTGVYGIAQLVLGHPPLALLVPVFAVLAAAIVYLAALVGQGLSIADMYHLRAFVDDCLRDAEAASSRPGKTAAESSQL